MNSSARIVTGKTILHTIAVLAVLFLCVLVSRPAGAQPVEVISLSIGDAHVVETNFDLSDVIIGNNEVANMALLSARSIAITPLSAGSTKVLLRDVDGRQRGVYKCTRLV